MTFIVFGIVVLIKYLPLYFYDIQKNLTQDVGKLLINSFKILFLFIPFFLRLICYGPCSFGPSCSRDHFEQGETVGCLFSRVLIYLPFFLHSSATFLNGSSSDIILEMHRATHEDWDRDLEQRLQAWLVTQPEDPDTLFTLGLIEKRRETLFKQKNGTSVLFPRVLNLAKLTLILGMSTSRGKKRTQRSPLIRRLSIWIR